MYILFLLLLFYLTIIQNIPTTEIIAIAMKKFFSLAVGINTVLSN